MAIDDDRVRKSVTELRALNQERRVTKAEWESSTTNMCEDRRALVLLGLMIGPHALDDVTTRTAWLRRDGSTLRFSNGKLIGIVPIPAWRVALDKRRLRCCPRLAAARERIRELE